ncbi:amidohydrolase [Isoptericola sp. b408]|uniref:amidohydrolase n=1 Tax=Isoptericola sp. b408 TaxID=3064653 RepID=UPI002714066D|nr:amidohydrolase [Isoptericola sp. b408]MDO8150123.1 amidohydrolase [Isoptericola sp. b408]
MSTLTGADLTAICTDLHAHPELAFAEHRTAGIVADRLGDRGYAVHRGIGGTGVVGVLANGDGPTVLLRADMDGLPVTERTGLPYASQETGTMHACGHDVHVTCLLGAADALAARRGEWSGTLQVLFQPAEEVGAGARAMVEDGLYERVGTPDVVLGQHVMPFPVGTVNLTPGPAMAAADSLRVTLHGRGGHGSSPESTVDPVLLAAAVVQRLQGVVSREVGIAEKAVVTVGSIRAGTQANIIPDRAELLVNVRTFDEGVRERVLAAVHRIVDAEAVASGAPRPPEYEQIAGFGVLVNEPEASHRTGAALGDVLTAHGDAIRRAGGAPAVVAMPPIAGSEDVGELAAAAGAPLVYWHVGGADPALFAGVDPASLAGMGSLPAGVAPNHSPEFAPVLDPTLDLGVALLVGAATAWLD